MKTPFQIVRRTVDVIVLSAIALAIYYWASPRYFPTKIPPLVWEESVVLPDQRVVVLKRVQHFDEGDYVGAHSFEFEHPVTKQVVKWQSDAALYVSTLPQAANWQKRPTDGFFSLVALFMVQDVPHILVSPTFGGQNEQAGCPHPSMFVYKYTGTRWEQIPYAANPVRVVTNNTTIDPKSNREYIKATGFKVPAGGVRVIRHPSEEHYYGVNLDRFPAQVFQCPNQKRFDFR